MIPSMKQTLRIKNRSTRDDRSDEQLIAEALKVAEGADVIIAALGESIDMSGEGASRAILEMPQTQKNYWMLSKRQESRS